MSNDERTEFVALAPEQPFWERFYTIAPLVVVGTREEDGGDDLAPKHMATPLGWSNYFGFVCAPTHGTYSNAKREQGFAVSFPRPMGLLQTTLSATPREYNGSKPITGVLDTIPAETVRAPLLVDAYLHLECELERILDGFGANSFIIGKVTAARVHVDYLRQSDQDDHEQLAEWPLLAYVHPGRFAVVGETHAFPFPLGFKR